MNGDAATAEKYRKHADDIRLMADRTTDADTRKLLLSVAAIYERLAAMIGGIAYIAANSN